GVHRHNRAQLPAAEGRAGLGQYALLAHVAHAQLADAVLVSCLSLGRATHSDLILRSPSEARASRRMAKRNVLACGSPSKCALRALLRTRPEKVYRLARKSS